MPNMDGTGPTGQGPKTGRQRGKCEGAENQNADFGRGQGMGGGRGCRGRGGRRNFCGWQRAPPQDKEQKD